MLSSPNIRVPTLAMNFADRTSRISSITLGLGILPTSTNSATPVRRAPSSAVLSEDIFIH